MANVILCHGKLAKKPYNVVGIGINVYSAEELCFIIAQNAHTLDRDFMDENLCIFLEEELSLRTLALKLREIINRQGGLGEFVVAILEGVNYCDTVEIKSIKQILVESAGLSPARKHKSRADNLFKARKYGRALDEYIGTLDRIDKEAEPLLYAAVLHNMGTTYAKLLLYKKASEYYLEAYRLNMDDESLVLHLVCSNLSMPKEQYEKMLIRCGYKDKVIEDAKDRLNLQGGFLDVNNRYAKEFNYLKDLKNSGKIGQYYHAVDETLNAWKQEYRANMIL